MKPSDIERLIRYVDAMAGEDFEDATELMLDLFKEYNVDSAESLIKKLLTD